jgi:hypothetical protein
VGGHGTIFAIIPNPQIKKSSSCSSFVIIILLVAQSVHAWLKHGAEKTPVFSATYIAPVSLLYFPASDC